MNGIWLIFLAFSRSVAWFWEVFWGPLGAPWAPLGFPGNPFERFGGQKCCGSWIFFQSLLLRTLPGGPKV